MRHKILTPISILGMTVLRISILHEIYLQFAQDILATTSWSSTILVGFASIVLFYSSFINSTSTYFYHCNVYRR